MSDMLVQCSAFGCSLFYTSDEGKSTYLKKIYIIYECHCWGFCLALTCAAQILDRRHGTSPQLCFYFLARATKWLWEM